MTNSVQSLQSTQSQKQTDESVQPPKTLQTNTAKQNAAATQDSVTISQEARQALTHSTVDTGGGGVNDYSHSR